MANLSRKRKVREKGTWSVAEACFFLRDTDRHMCRHRWSEAHRIRIIPIPPSRWRSASPEPASIESLAWCAVCMQPARQAAGRARRETSGRVGANKKRSVCSPVPDCQPILILTSCGHGHGGGHAGRTRRAPAPASPVHPGRRRGRRRFEREREGKAGGNLSKKTAGA